MEVKISPTVVIKKSKKTSSDSGKMLFFYFLFGSFLIHLTYVSFTKLDFKSDFVPVSDSEPIKLKIIQQKRSAKRQIVETKQKETKDNLNKARDVFLGKNNSAVKKNTIAKRIGKFNNENGTATVRSNSKSSKTKSAKKSFSLSDLSFNKNLIKPLDKKIIARKNSPTSPGGTLLQSASNDHVKNIPLGDITQLNTTKFKFYGFYHRIKQKLEQHWGNSLRRKASEIYKSGKKIKSEGEKLTALLVILDNKGNILQVKLKSTSGVEELDQAAVESFNKAGPFPNPPKEMLKSGKAQIEWGFVVKT